jgi:hypothetical protein
MALTALATWIITALGGGYMLAVTLRTGNPDTPTTGSHLPPSVMFLHPLAAVAGLCVWIAFVANGERVLAWIAAVDLLLVAGLGDILLVCWLKNRRQARAETSPRAAVLEGPTAGLAEQQIPVAAVVGHGLLAVLTIALVFLSALGVGN